MDQVQDRSIVVDKVGKIITPHVKKIMLRCSGLTEENDVKKKRDVRHLVAVIPPASQLLRREGPKRREKRIRVRLKAEIQPEELHLNPSVAKYLNITSKAELSVPGKKRMEFKAVINENVPENEVWVNEEIMRERGVADNSLATVRGT